MIIFKTREEFYELLAEIENEWCIDSTFRGESSISTVYYRDSEDYRYDVYRYDNGEITIFKDELIGDKEESQDYKTVEKYLIKE